MAKHTSYRGQTIDIEMMKFQNQHASALGNGRMNARGDKLGSGGTIVKTREELLAERERQMQLPDYIPEHTSHAVQVQTSSEGFDDAMFELPEQEPVQEKAAPVQVQEESTSKAAPRRVRATKDAE
jgi:hypothetical protein